MLIVLYTKDEVSFDRFQKNKDQLYRIMVTSKDEHETRTFGSTNAIHGPTFKQDIPEIKEVIRAQSTSFVIERGCTVCGRAFLLCFHDAAAFRRSQNGFVGYSLHRSERGPG
jgi:putative ABC transport system permease protein